MQRLFAVVELLKREILIPVCPEQLGGLSTPRQPSELRGGQVCTASGLDETAQYLRGATETLAIACLLGVEEAILKQRSPSCGCGQVYDGTFTHSVVAGDGLTTALLKRHGIHVISEEDL
jgi:uncharacterized protein YbbK (DUF523 family)